MSELKSIFQQLNPKADWFGLRKVKETNHYRQTRNGQPEENTVAFESGAMVEVLVKGQFAYAATNDLTLSGINRATEQAVERAEQASQWSLFKATTEMRPPAQGSFQGPYEKGMDSLTTGEINNHLVKATEQMKTSDKIVNAVATLLASDTECEILTSNNTEIEQKYLHLSTNFAATAQDGGETQSRSTGFQSNCNQVGLETLENPQLMSRLHQISEEAIELLSAENCPSGQLDTILMPDQMILQIHESIGHPLELDRILGDERNYAGWSFVKLSDFGSLTYGSPLMNITFDPTVSGEFASYAFDDTGLKAEKEYLIQGGQLLRGLGGSESQARSKTPGVSNSRATSWNRPPIDRMANINLEPGSSSMEDMISQVEKGVIMFTNKSWSIDDYRNKFQFGCEYAKLIENGKVTRTLKNPNYRGVTNPFWHSLKAVGNAETMSVLGSPFCGKGEPNQIIRVGHASPACLFKNIEVFGGLS